LFILTNKLSIKDHLLTIIIILKFLFCVVLYITKKKGG
jgi:hypothetical protein